MNLRLWWLNLGEGGFLAYWRSLPWRCRFGFHKLHEVVYRDVPDYPWHADYATECERCGHWFGWSK